MIRTCVVCAREFESPTRACICSDECRRARRRTYDAGCSATVGGLPPPQAVCEICGKTFRVDRCKKTCSDVCLIERRRSKSREAKRRELADPGKRARAVERARRRRRENPEMAKAQDKHKWERQMFKEAADPAEAERRRQRARDFYAGNAEHIQAKRRAKLDAMPDEELAEVAERMRVYNRRHRQRVMADPARRAKYQEYQQEFRRRQNEAKAADDVARLGQLLKGRENASKVKPCIVCGKPVVGRRPMAKVCSRACRAERSKKLAHPPRPRPCAVCGTIFDARTCAKVCSPECQEARRRGIPLEAVPRIERRAEEAACDVCGKVFHPWRARQRGCSPDCMRAGRIRRRCAKIAKPTPPRACAICGKEFQPIRPNNTVCRDPECRAERKRRMMRNGPFPPKPCIVCGKEFAPLMEKAVVCSRMCRRIRRRELERLRNAQEKTDERSDNP